MAGADVGGYAGTPTAELLTKWIEIAAFQPIDRDHAEKGTGPHEPWANGPAQEDIRRKFIEARYQLLPYFYTVIEDNTRSGLPLLRPLFLEFPDVAPDKHPMDIDLDTAGEFMVGPDLLVGAPPFPDKAGDYDVKLPSVGWYDYWTGAKVQTEATLAVGGGLQPEAGGTQAAKPAVMPSVRVHRELASLPVYVRPGAILPIEPLVESTDEKPTGPLTLRVFPGPDCHGSLYQDDGSTFAYRSGGFLRMSFTCEVSPGDGAISLHIGKHEGGYPAWWKQIVVEVNGLATRPRSATVDGRRAETQSGSGPIRLTLPDDGKGIEVVLR
jgi:alpha-glucosidase